MQDSFLKKMVSVSFIKSMKMTFPWELKMWESS